MTPSQIARECARKCAYVNAGMRTDGKQISYTEILYFEQLILAALTVATVEQKRDGERLDWLEGSLGRNFQRTYSSTTITRQTIDAAMLAAIGISQPKEPRK